MFIYRLNTIGAKIHVGTDENGDKKNIYLGDFKESDEYNSFLRRSGKEDCSRRMMKMLKVRFVITC